MTLFIQNHATSRRSAGIIAITLGLFFGTPGAYAQGLLPEYVSWASSQSIPSNQNGYTNTPAGDGVPNLVKFATGLNAMDFVDADKLFDYTADEQLQSIEMQFKRSTQATNVVLMPQWTPSLDGDLRTLEYGIERLSVSNGKELWHASLPLSPGGFWRLSAAVDEPLLRNRYRSPFAVAYNATGTWLAATDHEQGVVYFIDPTSATPSVQYRVVLHGKPCDLDWAGNTLYVAEYGASTVAEIQFINGTPKVVRRIDTGSMPYSLRVAPSKGVMLVADFGLHDVRTIDLATGATFNKIELPGNASFMDIDDTETTAVVSSLTPNRESAFELNSAAEISIIDVASGNLIANVALPSGSTNVRDVQISRDRKWAYVVHTQGTVALPTLKLDTGWVNSNVISIIDLNSKTRLATIPLDKAAEGWANPWGLALSADGKTLWITSDGVHKLGKLKLAELHTYLDGSANSGGGAGGEVLTFTVINNGNGTYNVIIQWPPWLGDPNFNSSGYDDNYTILCNGNLVSDWPGNPLPTSYTNKNVSVGLYTYQVFPYEGKKTNRIGEYTGVIAVGDIPQPPKFGGDIWEEIWKGNESLASLENHFGALHGPSLFDSIDLLNNQKELCKGPRGIDISPVNGELAVAAYFKGQILLIDPQTGLTQKTVDIGFQPKKDNIRQGEENFADGTLCYQRWLACTTCHPGARTDGMNWDMGNDGYGSYKNTKSLVGAEYTAPTTWTAVRSGATASVLAGFLYIHFASADKASDTQAYLASLRPDRSPYLDHGSLTPLARRGHEVFVAQGCAHCHTGEWYTDLKLYDVGSGRTEDKGATKFDNPSLVEMWCTGPFTHDGRAGSLESFLSGAAGTTHDVAVPAEDMDALVEYLNSL